VLLLSATGDVVVTVNPEPQVLGMSFQAEAGTVQAPFVSSGGVISQASETGLSSSGRAAYLFSVPTAGNYVVNILVNAPSEARNSLFVNIDAEPVDPGSICHIPVTSGAQTRTVSWQGNGTFDNPQFVPKVFSLSAGTHELIIRGREGGVQIDSISITTPAAAPQPPTNLRVTLN
jgi:hypothetical protein